MHTRSIDASEIGGNGESSTIGNVGGNEFDVDHVLRERAGREGEECNERELHDADGWVIGVGVSNFGLVGGMMSVMGESRSGWMIGVFIPYLRSLQGALSSVRLISRQPTWGLFCYTTLR